jgi:hypothetical protein
VDEIRNNLVQVDGDKRSARIGKEWRKLSLSF